MLLYFFSSRRRHTRLQGDWSSDVCSSDLPSPINVFGPIRILLESMDLGLMNDSSLKPRSNADCISSTRLKFPKRSSKATNAVPSLGSKLSSEPSSKE